MVQDGHNYILKFLFPSIRLGRENIQRKTDEGNTKDQTGKSKWIRQNQPGNDYLEERRRV